MGEFDSTKLSRESYFCVKDKFDFGRLIGLKVIGQLVPTA